MSRDQKPAKMRVIAGSEQAPLPLRRAGDYGPELSPALPVMAEAQDRVKFGLLSLIFVACSAVGGVGVMLLVRSFGH